MQCSVSSSSPKAGAEPLQGGSGCRHRLTTTMVWAARLIVGCTFIISGWSKAIDPWGFLIKVNEYLAAWGWSLPRELVLAPCIALSCVEFCTGILVASGSMKRAAVWVAAAMMLFMTPLTLYIAIADPVPDCGCFGDFLVISNWATFGKNIVLSALIVYLIIAGGRRKGIFPAPIQWLVIVAAVVFPLFLSLAGFHVQPLVDFRPYKTGTELFADTLQDDAEVSYIYEKDGRRHTFGLSELPDSTWSFVEAVETFDSDSDSNIGFEVRDDSGEPVNSDFEDTDTPLLIIVVPESDITFLSQIHFANRLAEYAVAHGVETIGLVGTSGDYLEKWRALMRPLFEVYSVEDTSLKQLVRGDAGAVYVGGDGLIKWKRTLRSVPREITEATGGGNLLRSLPAVDMGNVHLIAVLILVLSLTIIYLLGLSPKILRLFTRQTKKNA